MNKSREQRLITKEHMAMHTILCRDKAAYMIVYLASLFDKLSKFEVTLNKHSINTSDHVLLIGLFFARHKWERICSLCC